MSTFIENPCTRMRNRESRNRKLEACQVANPPVGARKRQKKNKRNTTAKNGQTPSDSVYENEKTRLPKSKDWGLPGGQPACGSAKTTKKIKNTAAQNGQTPSDSATTTKNQILSL